MNYKKYKILIPLLCIQISLLASCGKATANDANKETATGNTAAKAETADSGIADPVPAIDFGGAEFIILTSDSTTQHTVTAYNEQVGEILDDTMYSRTKAIEEKFNLTFLDDHVAATVADSLSLFRNSVSAGDNAYDLAMLLERNAFSITQEGCFYDIASLPYVDLTQPWWFGEVNNTINLSDKTYLSYGCVNLGLYDMMHVLLFNKTMQNRLDLENPYDLVIEGTWTLDKMAEMARAAISDANGDGTWGREDIYGFVGGSNTTVVDFLAAARVRTIAVDDKKNVEIRLISDPKIEEIYSKVADLFWEPGFWWTKSESSNNYYLTDTFFQTDQALFADHTLYSVGLLRDMQSDYGIIPFPKYDADQKEYGTMAEAGTRTMTVPVTIENPDMIGAVLETLNFLSYRDVMPAYYETTLKQKYSRDSVSAQMLDIITENVFYDLGDTMFNDKVKDGLFAAMFKKNMRDYVSRASKTLKSLEADVQKAKGE